MKVEYRKTQYDNTPSMSQEVEEDTKLKEIIVQYVGSKINPKEEKVTVENIVDIFADEFPEFVLALAEENWIRGYNQGVADKIVMQKDDN